MGVSIILPCYKPQPDWESTLCEQYALLKNEIHEDIELILVLDGMPQKFAEATTANLAKRIPELRIVRYDTNRGKGFAVREGVRTAIKEIIIYTDVDLPYTTNSIVSVYRTLRDQQRDIAFGVKDARYYAHVPASRKLISKALRALTRVLLSMPETDTQCGLKGFRQEVKPFFLTTEIDRYLFDLEFLYKGYQAKTWQIEAVPVTLRENITFRKMNYGILIPEMVNFAKLFLRRNK